MTIRAIFRNKNLRQSAKALGAVFGIVAFSGAIAGPPLAVREAQNAQNSAGAPAPQTPGRLGWAMLAAAGISAGATLAVAAARRRKPPQP